MISLLFSLFIICGFSPHIVHADTDDFGNLGLGNAASNAYDSLPSGNVDSDQSMVASFDSMGVSDVQADAYRLSGKGSHSPYNLLPSVLFSQANGTLDSAKLSLRDLSLYPSADDSNEAYGNLTNPRSLLKTETPQKVGVETANYIKTLYDYDWLVPYPKDNDIPIIGAFADLIRDGKKALQSLATAWALRFAYIGAFIFDIFSNLIATLAKWADGLNIPGALGFVNVDNDELSNVLNSILLKTLKTFSISPSFLRLLKGFVWMLILTSFVMMMVIALANPKSSRNSPWTRLKRLAVRVLVVVMTIPMAVSLKIIIDDMTKNITGDFQAAVTFNNHYVVDTLSWAATMNLSLASINPSATESTLYNGGQLFDANGKSPFAPTNENVKNLAATTMAKMSLISKYSEVSKTVDGTEIKSANKIKAYQALGQALSADVVSVNDYLNIIGGLPDNGDQGSQVAAKNFPRLNNPIDVGPAYKGNYLNRYRPAYFLFANPNASDSFDANIKPSEEVPAGTAYQALEWVPIGLNSTMFPFSSGSPMKMIPVTWNQPKSYIYSALLATESNEQSADISNFTNGAGTYQNNNPRTGEDLEADQSDPAVSKQDLYTNSASIAIANKYGGIATVNGGGIRSLSTQSVALLLQSNYDKSSKTLIFQGYNTTPTKTGATKVTSKNGNRFYRYTIPNTGAGDLTLRVGQLNAIWIISALCAVTAFIYLLKAPIFSAIIKMLGSFISALFTGNLPALLQYLAYYAALKLSFSFALIGCYLGSIIGNAFMNFINGSSLKFIQLFGTIDVLGFGMILFALAVGVALTWPSIALQIGRGTKKTSILGAVVMFPYLLAESFDEYLDQFHRVLYGKGKNQTFARKMANQVRQPVGSSGLGKALVKTGIQAGAAVATGGASLATAGATGAMALMNLKKSQANAGIEPNLDPGSVPGAVIGMMRNQIGKNPLSAEDKALLTNEEYDLAFRGTSLYKNDNQILEHLQANSASLGKLPDKIDDDDILRYKADQLAKYRPQMPDEQTSQQGDPFGVDDVDQTTQPVQPNDDVRNAQAQPNAQPTDTMARASDNDQQTQATQTDRTNQATQANAQDDNTSATAHTPNADTTQGRDAIGNQDAVEELRKLNASLTAMMNGGVQPSQFNAEPKSTITPAANDVTRYQTDAPKQGANPTLNSKVTKSAMEQSYFAPDAQEETALLQARRQLLAQAEARKAEIDKIDRFIAKEGSRGKNVDLAKMQQLKDVRSKLSEQVAKIEAKVQLQDKALEVKAKVTEAPRVKAVMDLASKPIQTITNNQAADLAKSMSNQVLKNLTGMDAKELTPEGIRQSKLDAAQNKGQMTRDDIAEFVDALRDNTKAVEDVAAAQDRFNDW